MVSLRATYNLWYNNDRKKLLKLFFFTICPIGQVNCYLQARHGILLAPGNRSSLIVEPWDWECWIWMLVLPQHKHLNHSRQIVDICEVTETPVKMQPAAGTGRDDIYYKNTPCLKAKAFIAVPNGHTRRQGEKLVVKF